MIDEFEGPAVAYWLMKSEPDVYGIEHLKKLPGKTDSWDGVRNYQARNMMRDDMKKGDLVFFYHSNCKEPGIAGITDIEIVVAADRWHMVDIKYVRTLKRVITLTELKEYSELQDMPLVRRGNRLSVMPVTQQQWDFILSLE